MRSLKKNRRLTEKCSINPIKLSYKYSHDVFLFHVFSLTNTSQNKSH